jgi:transposase
MAGSSPAMMEWTAPRRHRCAKLVDVDNQAEEAAQMKIITIGMDVAKNVFQLHMDESGVVRRLRLGRGRLLEFFGKLSPAVVGMEACGGAHHWARAIEKLGHEVKLMPPCYVKPYVKRNKTDGRDAEAIWEAMQRPTMRFVAVKSVEQQAVVVLHRARALMVRQRTQLANALRAHFAEFGMVAAQGIKGVRALLAQLPGSAVPPVAQPALAMLAAQWQALDASIGALERQIKAAVRADEAACRIMQIPGVGPITASAVVAAVADMRQFRSGRGFAAWLGLTPRQNNSGTKRRAGRISKQGDGTLRSLLVLGATARLRYRNRINDPWLSRLLMRRPVKVAAVALAAKTARIIWALLAKGEDYRAPAQLAA